MTLQQLKDLAAAIQSFTVAAAALIGGGWALFRFLSLRSVQKARADLEQVQRTLLERGILQVSLHAEQVTSALGHFIAVRASLANVGNSTEVIDWSASSLVATRLTSSAGGNLQFSEAVNQGQRPAFIKQSTIMPAETLKHSFLVPVPEAGVYYLLFHVTCSPKASSIIHHEVSGTGVELAGTETWSEDLFFNVTDMRA